jgi:NosR/NirI family nitrous oxide reductase transcriptional regulator
MRIVGRLFHRGRNKRTFARPLFSILIAVVVLAAMAVPVLACDINIEPSSASGGVGDTLTFTVTVAETHRNCTVPIGDTQIYLTNMELVSQSPWEQIADGVNEKQVTVRLLDAGEGSIEVVRECPKGGGDVIVYVAIEPSVAVASPPASGKPDDEGAVPVAPPGDEVGAPADDAVAPVGEDEDGEEASAPPATPAGPTFGEAISEALRQPYVVVLLVLMIAGTLALARGYRRARPFAMLISLGFLGFYVGGCPCPIGALQNAFIWLGNVTGHMIVYVQFAAVVLAALVVGRVFCGWACPMGATQYFLYRKESGKKARRFEISREQHNTLRWMKYGVLAVLIGLVMLTRQPVFEEVDPFKALFNLDFSPGLPLLFLVVLLTVSIVIGLPFCKYFCPLGAFLGLLQSFSIFKIRFSDACTRCGICHNVACDYMAIEPGDPCPTVNQMECVRCGECLARCPCNAISFTARR